MHSDVYFEKALRWYDEQKADAVLLCGDIADCGLVSELEYAAAIIVTAVGCPILVSFLHRFSADTSNDAEEEKRAE